MSDRPTVSVVVVTYDSESDLSRCLDSLGHQSHRPFEVLVIDNASSDRTEDVARHYGARCHFVRNDDNIGFAAAQNAGIRQTSGELYLALNPDTELTPSFIEEMVAAMELDPQVGSVSGKLLRFASANATSVIDSTGIYFTPSLRHLDRGSGQPDRGQFDRPQYVFGASGAAALYRRAMLEDVAVDGEYFDEDFFSYREDADLAWRAQLRGWKALYTPRAVARHRRRVLPERRDRLPAAINMHSVKNRFLLRIKNQSFLEAFVLLVPSLWRDLQVVVYVLLFERTSLPGLTFVLRNWERLLAKRRGIQSRRKTSSRRMLRWFRRHPVARDLPRQSP